MIRRAQDNTKALDAFIAAKTEIDAMLERLAALSAEIVSPGKGILDAYLLPFVGTAQERHLWGGAIGDIRGLDGRSIEDTVDGEYSDARVAQKYQAFELKRGRTVPRDR